MFENPEFMSFVFVPCLMGIILFIFWILGIDPLDKQPILCIIEETTTKGLIMKFENTPSGKLLAEFRTAIMESITVPNHLLPAEFHDDVRGCRTLARLDQLCDKRDGVSEHTKLKALKARNVERLAAQVEAKSVFAAHGDFVDLSGELDYSDNECDDLQLTKNMQALVGGMVNRGLIDADDLLED